MRITTCVYVAALVTSAIGCEDTNHPPGAPSCESASVDAAPSDGAPRKAVPCPMPSTGGAPGGYSVHPIAEPGGIAAGGSGTDGGGAGEVTGSGGVTGFGSVPGASGLKEPGGKPRCCG